MTPLILTSSQHRREAERLLSRASFTLSDKLATPALDPQATALLVARAQVHATLAQTEATQAEAYWDVDATRVVVCHIAEGLMSPSAETRGFMAGLADELERVGVDVDGAVYDLSNSTGAGPFHYTVAGVVYDLTAQVSDRYGTAWEHSGGWTAAQEPIMRTPDVVDPADAMTAPLRELVLGCGPLRPVGADVAAAS